MVKQLESQACDNSQDWVQVKSIMSETFHFKKVTRNEEDEGKLNDIFDNIKKLC